MAGTLIAKRLFAERVAHFREKLELTQAGLGKRVGVSATCVWNWEGANTFPRPATLRHLANVLGTTVSHLSGAETTSSNEDQDSASKPMLSQVIMNARAMVASAAGVSVSNVRVVLDCGD